MNEFIFILAVVIFLCATVLMYKFFGKIGIYVFVGFATILANIQVSKSIVLFGLTTTAGNVLYAATFLSTDILSENHGKKAAQKAVILGIVINILWLIGTQLTLWFKPSATDTMHQSMKSLFGVIPRITIASLIGYIVSQSLDVLLYHLIWKKTGSNNKKLWLRNNAATMISQLVDTLLFVTIAFIKTVPTSIFLQILGTTYLFKIIVGLCDTPFIYLARKIKNVACDKEEIKSCQDKKVK